MIQSEKKQKKAQSARTSLLSRTRAKKQSTHRNRSIQSAQKLRSKRSRNAHSRRVKGKKKEFSKSVGAVVLNSRNQVLLVFQKKNRYWEFPKGKVEAGEREMDTLKREIYEETGIKKFRMAKNFRRVMHYEFRFKGRIIDRRVVYFLIKTSDKVQISEEHNRFMWLPLSKAKKRLKHQNQVSLIDDVIKRVYG